MCVGRLSTLVGVCGITVTVIGNELSEPSSNPGRDCSHFTLC